VASALKKLLKELPTKEQMTEMIFDLKSHGDAATAMMGCAYPEHALESLFKAHFRPLNSEDTTRMFDGAAGGILGTFTAKIRLAYALHLLRPVMYQDLLLLAQIRNAFAHSLHKVTFESAEVMSDCYSLSMIRLSKPEKPARPTIEIFANVVLFFYLDIIDKIQQATVAPART
jgi:hypothetical protein